MLKKFHNVFKLSQEYPAATDELIERYQSKVPNLLLDLWKRTGIGKYNDGLIELIDPTDFEPSLWTWLGEEVEEYTPIAISGFGELFYYRKLTEEDEDVCMLDIQNRLCEVLTYDFETFFENFLVNEDERKEWLREELFEQAISKYGSLSKNEVFTFAPALALGGHESVENLQKGNAQAYLDIMFQITM